MKLFENKVGRPSNETLKKRKMFYFGVAAGGFLIILLIVLSLSSLSSINLTGATAQNFVKGEKVNIPNKTKVYISKKSKLSLVRAKGVFYIQDTYNGRVKISKKSKGIALGWVNKDGVEKISSTENETSLTTYNKGDVDRNGKLTENDANLVLKFVAGDINFNSQQKQLADMDGDGKITAVDAGKILSEVNANKKIIVDFSKTATLLGRTSYHNVTLKTSGDTFQVGSSKPKIVSVDQISASSFVLRALDSGTSVITVKSKKTGEMVTFNYTVPAYELPSADRFGAAAKNFVSKGKKNGISVYAENTCNKGVVDKYIADINALKGYAAKTVKAIYIASPASIKYVYGSDLLSGKALPTNANDFTGFAVIDLNCKQYDDYKVFHETAHAIDFRYRTYYSRFASEDFEDLMIKYKPGPNQTPIYLRDLSYSAHTEFFADSYAMYLGKTTWKTNSEINNKVKTKIEEIEKIGW